MHQQLSLDDFHLGDTVRTRTGKLAKVERIIADRLSLRYVDGGKDVVLRPWLCRHARPEQLALA